MWCLCANGAIADAEDGSSVLRKLADILEEFYLQDLMTILRHDSQHCHFGLTIK